MGGSSHGPQAVVTKGTCHAEQLHALQSPDLGKPSLASPGRREFRGASFHVLGHLCVFFVEMLTEILYLFLIGLFRPPSRQYHKNILP